MSTIQSLRTQEAGLVPDSMWPAASRPLGPYSLAQWLCFGELLLSFMAGVMGENSCPF